MNVPFETVTPAPADPAALPFRVRMRDGVRLATDVYLPDGEAVDEPGPTILVRLPYDKSGTYASMPLIARYLTRRGYHVAVQDVRGKFRSEGETLLFVNEVHDGYDTIEWITHQPWSDGIVGMWGDSYYGYTQWAAVASGHRALRAIAPRVTGTELGQVVDNPDGTRDVEMGIHLGYMATHYVGPDTYEWEPDPRRRPLIAPFEEFFRTVGRRSPSFDIAFPQEVRLRRWPEGHPFEHRAVPVLHTVGWYDNCAPWHWRDIQELARRPDWANQQYLLIEPIDHENYRLSGAPYDDESRDHALSQDAFRALLPAYLEPALDFFDVFLRRRGSAADLPRVRWHHVHGEEDDLRTGTVWPPAESRALSLYLAAGTQAPDGATSGLLSPAAPADTGAATWIHDPEDPVPSAAPNAFAYLQTNPRLHDWSKRDDVLVFDAEPALTPLDLAGPVSLDITLTTTGPSTDLFAKLLDVHPDGEAELVAHGRVHIDNPARRLTLSLGHAGYRLRTGHQLRLHLHSSDFPEFVIHPGTDENPWLAIGGARTAQQIRLGGTEGARLTLTTLPT
ncbi:CocE/NonD family hydrolase [Streptomyces phaeochromogenes]|uniref:CocE/NonD family hydrolase n=1 Tax=Streptomyces phaeochromogenes TaxID=1923 RepID=UPI002DDB5137|nr:CocE/NonD family hydrolase [Streptomyces phaeochromogenes]WRZ34680.1 CocE/NonD family hydrolase [Streptomyces phaeochromogenes]